MRIWIISAVLMAAALGADTGTVAGTVQRTNGPVASARVVVDSAVDSKYGVSTTTDRDGRFTVSDAPVGAVGVKVYDDNGRILAQGRATITHAGERVTLTLRVP